MKSYLEITWLMNAAIIFVCWTITSIFHQHSIRPMFQCMCAVICSVLSWCMKDVGYGSYLVRMGFGFFLYRRQLFAPIQSILFQISIMSLCGFVEDFQMRRGILYVSSLSHRWIGVVLICLMADGFIRKWLPHLHQQAELHVPVRIETDYEQIHCIGYLDTGNCALWDDLPVVFVKQKIQCNTTVEIESVTGTSVFEAVTATLIIENQVMNVMVAYAPLLQVECLLHAKMR